MRVASLALMLLRTPAVQSSVRIMCDTTVAVGDGVVGIELWPKTSPIGVQRVLDLADSRFLTDLPFYSVIEGHMITFGIHPKLSKQKEWDVQGFIVDDPQPCAPTLDTEGILSFSGDPGIGANSRSTLFFLTLNKAVQWHRRRPWEVPVGKVVKGLDVMRGIFSGYGDEPQLGMLDPTQNETRASAYLAGFPNLDRIRSCRVVRDNDPDSDPAHGCKDEV